MRGLFRIIVVGVILYIFIDVNMTMYSSNEAFIEYYQSLMEQGKLEFEKAMSTVKGYIDSESYRE